jgi:hypothetical protein
VARRKQRKCLGTTIFTHLKKNYTKRRSDAKKKGTPFKISFDHVCHLLSKQQGRCAYSGQPLEFAPNSNNLVSIDRINSNKGYIYGNVQLITADINYAKNDMSHDRFLAMVDDIKAWSKRKAA